MARLTGEELIGQRFGRLIVMSVDKPYIWNGKIHDYILKCKCDCGKETEVRRGSLVLKNGTRSCGCVHTEGLVQRNLIHNLSHTILYSRYLNIKERCYNPNCKAYKNYGGRGIKMCDEWFNNFESFYEWALSSGYKEELTIDRIDVNGDYAPDNCRWVTFKEQNLNKRNNRFFTYKGKTLSITQWGIELGGAVTLVCNRIDKMGWSVEKALSTPLMKHYNRKKVVNT